MTAARRYAKKRIHIAGLRQTHNRLVAAGVEGADRHGPAGGPFKHALVDLILLFLGWKFSRP
jgi:hypothetical protein